MAKINAKPIVNAAILKAKVYIYNSYSYQEAAAYYRQEKSKLQKEIQKKIVSGKMPMASKYQLEYAECEKIFKKSVKFWEKMELEYAKKMKAEGRAVSLGDKKYDPIKYYQARNTMYVYPKKKK